MSCKLNSSRLLLKRKIEKNRKKERKKERPPVFNVNTKSTSNQHSTNRYIFRGKKCKIDFSEGGGLNCDKTRKWRSKKKKSFKSSFLGPLNTTISHLCRRKNTSRN